MDNNANLVFGLLISSGAKTSQELIQRTGLSQPGVSRALSSIAEHTGRLAIHRRGRQFVYAILGEAISVHRISSSGDAHLFGILSNIEGCDSYSFAYPDGGKELFDGLPWFLQDMRPQGYIGRLFCHAHSNSLGLSDRLLDWSDAHVVHAVSRLGEDFPGNLVVGDVSLERLSSSHRQSPCIIEDLVRHYDDLADISVQGGVPGSSAGGEHPKFLAQFISGSARNVIVKFSPLLDGSPASTRWKDLLIAEHVALEILSEHDIVVPPTRIIHSEKRCYLESERYDRLGEKGRVGVISFAAIDDAFIGMRRRWSTSAEALLDNGMLGSEDVARIRLLEEFGRWISNTDMHFGNLSFYWDMHENSPRLNLAPVYDMLPMRYAPEKSEVVDREFILPGEIGQTEPVEWARDFWSILSDRADVSDKFREIARQNAAALDARLYESAQDSAGFSP